MSVNIDVGADGLFAGSHVPTEVDARHVEEFKGGLSYTG
jgi:hypothetical protein